MSKPYEFYKAKIEESKNILNKLEDLKYHADNYAEIEVKDGDAEALGYAIKLIKAIRNLREELEWKKL